MCTPYFSSLGRIIPEMKKLEFLKVVTDTKTHTQAHNQLFLTHFSRSHCCHEKLKITKIAKTSFLYEETEKLSLILHHCSIIVVWS